MLPSPVTTLWALSRTLTAVLITWCIVSSCCRAAAILVSATARSLPRPAARRCCADGDGGGYSSPFWGTYRQISDHGGHFPPGKHSTLVVFFKPQPTPH